jgi:hypothetical protein
VLRLLDLNGDGVVSFEELRRGCEMLNAHLRSCPDVPVRFDPLDRRRHLYG